VDVCPENLTVDAEQVRALVQQENVKAVVAVHISGALANSMSFRTFAGQPGPF